MGGHSSAPPEQDEIEKPRIARTQQRADTMNRQGNQERQKILREKKHFHGKDEIEQRAPKTSPPNASAVVSRHEQQIRRQPPFRSLMVLYTPNIPRIQVTICGAPNAMATPKIAPIHHPHDIRFAIAMRPAP